MSTDDIRCRIMEEELKTFWPQWHVMKRLGGGSFGDVFEIYRDNYGVRMYSALKVIQINDQRATYTIPPENDGIYNAGGNDEKFDGNDIPEVFMNEIRIMEALRGAPNIVAIEDFYFKRSSGTSSLYVRMELLISFEDVLADRLRSRAQFTIAEVLKIGKDICTALMYCEKRDIIHRDIKPANLFVDDFGDYKVGDFGASKRMETIHPTHTMTGIGTISYMAPEIFAGRGYNNNVDIYALGMVLYQLLNNGRTPFLPANGPYTAQDIDIANYKRLRGEELPPLTGIRVCGDIISARLDAIIRKACEPDNRKRYRTAKEFFEALSGQEARENNTEDLSKTPHTSENSYGEPYPKNTWIDGPDAARPYVRKERMIRQIEGDMPKKLVIACSAIILAAALIIIIGMNIKPGHKESVQSASMESENSVDILDDASPVSEVSDQSAAAKSEDSKDTENDASPASEVSDQSAAAKSEDSKDTENDASPASEVSDQSAAAKSENNTGKENEESNQSVPVESEDSAVISAVEDSVLRAPVKSVSLGREHSAAIGTDGSLWLWGHNLYGQVGDGSTEERHEPVKIMEDVQSVSLGWLNSAAITEDGCLWVWGSNDHGQVGDGSTEERHEPVKIMEGVQSVSLGDWHSAAIKTDGSLWMWGWNIGGKLGDGSEEDHLEPVKIMEGVQSVSLGKDHSAAIKTDGSLWMWGSNNGGDLGDGSTRMHNSPIKIMEGVQSVSLGDQHSAAIKTDGSLWMWGYNNHGQLGDGTTVDRHEPVKIMEGVQSVSLDYSQSAAVKTDGSLWAWGYNNHGQLGDGSTENHYMPVKILEEVQFVSLGERHSGAIKTDGSLWMWGSWVYGKLGIDRSGDSYEPVCVIKQY